MDYLGYERLRFECDNRRLTVTIDNGAVNAVDHLMHDEFARVFGEIQLDADSDLVVLTGAGNVFCAGGDMAWFQAMIDDPAGFREIAPAGKKIVSDLLNLEKPIVCRLNGHAAGLGATIALMCDVIVADESAKIGDPHVKAGLVAGDGGAVIWPQLVGMARAKEMLLTGDMVSAKTAAEWGLINYAVPSGDLDAKVNELASNIQGNPRWAVRWTKSAMNIALRDHAVKVMDAAIGYEMLSNMTADRQEAVKAFVEKRPPEFTGE